MRFRTLEIRWHDNKPISTCDFQPAPFKRARPLAGLEKNFAAHAYRLATGGEDNHVRLWMVHPNIRPSALVEEDEGAVVGGPRPPRVEYLATLCRHSAAVNVVRFSPSGDLIASAGDDGMIIIWAPSTSPQLTTYGSDLSQDELQYEKEYWKPRTSFRCTTMQVYDLAWSPNGEYIIAGSTDNTARVFASADGKCVCEVAEHTHFVQGVAWDPLNEYIATQSSDRSMHIYRISTKNGVFDAHAVGRNTRMTHKHSRTPSVHNNNGTKGRHGSSPRPLVPRRDANSAISDAESDRDTDVFAAAKDVMAPLTPTASVTSTPSTALSASMFPPPSVVPSGNNSSAPPSVIGNDPSSRRSSFSGSNAPSSPQVLSHQYARYGRSPSPMPPLPAIRTPLTPPVANIRLYGDESHTNFFRRLTFSPDGGLLLTPAGQFEDPSVIVPPQVTDPENATPTRGRKGRQTSVGAQQGGTQSQTAGSNSCVYVYSRANFARPPIAQLPGHKKASVAVRFSPILYELRSGVVGPAPATGGEHETKVHAHDGSTKIGLIDKGVDGSVDVDIAGPTVSSVLSVPSAMTSPVVGQRTPQKHRTGLQALVVSPMPRQFEMKNEGNMMMVSPTLMPADMNPPTPAASKPPTPGPSTSGVSSHAATVGTHTTGSVFALPYRMLYAVVTMDTVTIYDTQQASPFCLLTKLHYDEFTDVSWSPDGQCLVLSSRDGYCTLVIFDDIIPAHHTQQHALQLQSIAHNLSVPLSLSTSHHSQQSGSSAVPMLSPLITPVSASSSMSHPPPFPVTPSVPKKRAGGETLSTLAPYADGNEPSGSGAGTASVFVASTVGPQPTAEVGPSSGSGSINNGNNKEGKDSEEKAPEPPKKKRRVQLTRVGDLGP
ncbi:hypothetical protein AX15_005567 [Amanita polypyramis BW_CC]|nr:hypothetical protein AX15_005567 [Amanita polypyramis BW_CC]